MPTQKWTPYPVDYAFKNDVTQEQVFAQVEYLADFAVDGAKCCLICYGQTNSGKTFTLYGAKGWKEQAEPGQHSGIIPRMIKKVFEFKRDQEDKGNIWQFTMDLLEFTADCKQS